MEQKKVIDKRKRIKNQGKGCEKNSKRDVKTCHCLDLRAHRAQRAMVVHPMDASINTMAIFPTCVAMVSHLSNTTYNTI